jgi:hypothetical protein
VCLLLLLLLLLLLGGAVVVEGCAAPWGHLLLPTLGIAGS